MGSPTRFPNGVTNARVQSPLGALGMLDPSKFHSFFDDFDRYTAGDWVITTTEAGSGSATEAASSANGGVLVVTNDNADNDLDNFQLSTDGGTTVGETFKLTAGKKTFFKARFKLTDGNSAITDVDAFIGLSITDTSIIASAPSDSIGFIKDDGAATIAFRTTKNSTSTATGTATLTNDTYTEVAFMVDGVSTAMAWVDGVKIAEYTTNICDDEELAVSFAVQNGRASSSIMSIDYIFVAQER